jgi:effector-binding domain-containing protein
MSSAPTIEERTEQPYMGIRTQVTMRQMAEAIPQLLDEVFAWLAKQSIQPSGAPFMRYHVIDMAAKLDVELCVPVASTMPGDSRVSAGMLPAGRYASLVYTGVKRGIEGNKALLDWGAGQGLAWDRWVAEKGDAFGGRIERYLTDPDEEPDPAKWKTEVAIRLADDQPLS